MKFAIGAVMTMGLVGMMIGMMPTARGDEVKVPLGEVPKAVLDAVKVRFPSAVLKEAEKEVEDGKTLYEIDLTDKGKSIEVTLTPEGRITTIETTIAVQDLPKAVTAAIDAQYPRGTIRRAEEVVAYWGKDETRSYEVDVTTAAGKSVEIRLTPEGKVLESDSD